MLKNDLFKKTHSGGFIAWFCQNFLFEHSCVCSMLKLVDKWLQHFRFTVFKLEIQDRIGEHDAKRVLNLWNIAVQQWHRAVLQSVAGAKCKAALDGSSLAEQLAFETQPYSLTRTFHESKWLTKWVLTPSQNKPAVTKKTICSLVWCSNLFLQFGLWSKI